MTDDFPTKREARGGRHMKTNPYAENLKDRKYRQRVVGGKKNVRSKARGRGRQEDMEYSQDGLASMDYLDWDWDS